MKINAKNIIKIIFAITFAGAVMYSSSQFHETRCDYVDILIDDSTDIKFIDYNDVFQLIYSVNPDILGYKMCDINLFEIENFLKQQPYIKNVVVYKTINGHLKIEIQQRIPVLEVINRNNECFYIDQDGTIFPISTKYAPKVIVANGFIKENYDFNKQKTYNVYNEDFENSKIVELYRLAKLIKNDDFWTDQVEQIFVNNLNEFEIIPMVGPQILELGSIDDYDRKLYYLKSFFLNGLKKTGWDKYKQISVKYKNQIVCKK
ncbi:MAG: hypothetical protein MJ211_06810 [Bacteroidales bacterium]|nr:hypothetical protein [Bacteroidales bacterium]